MKIRAIIISIALLMLIILSCDKHDFNSPFDPDYWGGKEITAPSSLTKTQITIDSISLNWTLPENNLPDGYWFRIDKKTAQGDWIEKYKTVSADQLNCADKAEINKSLNYKVYVSYDENISSPKEFSFVNTFPAPTEFKIDQLTITSARLTWNDNSTGEEKFVIERKLSTSSTYSYLNEVIGTNNALKTYTDSDLLFRQLKTVKTSLCINDLLVIEKTPDFLGFFLNSFHVAS